MKEDVESLTGMILLVGGNVLGAIAAAIDSKSLPPEVTEQLKSARETVDAIIEKAQAVQARLDGESNALPS